MLEVKDNELEVFSNDLAIDQEVVGIYLAPKFNLTP